jgi:hypothetical protein
VIRISPSLHGSAVRALSNRPCHPGRQSLETNLPKDLSKEPFRR